MKHLNAFMSSKRIPNETQATVVSFENLEIDKRSSRQGFLQSIVGGVNRRGIDAAVSPHESSSDITCFSSIDQTCALLEKAYSNLKPRIGRADIIPKELLEKAWQNRVRVHLLGMDFV